MFVALMLLAQVACMVAGLALGGASTAAGGALLLASTWFMGANLGWILHVGKVILRESGPVSVLFCAARSWPTKVKDVSHEIGGRTHFVHIACSNAFSAGRKRGKEGPWTRS